MSTKIRLKRIGRRNRPFYRLIVIDSRKRRDGAAIEQVGWYNPIDPENSYGIKDDRILHWLREGAIPSNAVKKIMKREGLALRWHLMQQGVDEKEIEKELKKWELNRENVLAAREAKEAEKRSNKKDKSQAPDAASEADEAKADESEAAPETEEAKADEPEAAPETEEAKADELEAAPETEEAKADESEAAPETEEGKADEPEAAPEAEEASEEESSDETGEEE